MFCKKGVVKNFAKFEGKHLFQSLFFCKAAGNFVKKETLWHRYLPVNFAKFLTTAFYIERLWWLLQSFFYLSPETDYFSVTHGAFKSCY